MRNPCLKSLIWNKDVKVKNIILSKIIGLRGYNSGNTSLRFCTLSHDVDDDKESMFEIDTLRNIKNTNKIVTADKHSFKVWMLTLT